MKTIFSVYAVFSMLLLMGSECLADSDEIPAVGTTFLQQMVCVPATTDSSGGAIEVWHQINFAHMVDVPGSGMLIMHDPNESQKLAITVRVQNKGKVRVFDMGEGRGFVVSPSDAFLVGDGAKKRFRCKRLN